MFRSHAHPRFANRFPAGVLALAFSLVVCIGVGGCGDSEPPAAPGAAPSASAPRERPSADLPGARELLARLRSRVTAGTGLGDAAWEADLSYLGRLLWPEVPEWGVQSAAQIHEQLANIAGDVGRDLARKPDDRADWAARDALSLEIHDAWLVATADDPDAYRAWVEAGGGMLAQRLRAERAKLFRRK